MFDFAIFALLLTWSQDKRWWDYRALFNTRASRYRLACNVCFSMFARKEILQLLVPLC